MTRMNLDKDGTGIVNGPCQNCGKRAHEHEKTREYHGNGLYSYNYTCPEDT